MSNGWRTVGLAIALAGLASGQAGRPSLEPRAPAGKNESAAGLLLARTGPDRPWQYVEPGAEVATRDRLLALPGTRATVEAAGGKVGLDLWGNVPQQSQFPGFQSEVVLHDSRSYDLDFTLVCGRVVLTNKKAGPVRVWARLPGLAGACQLTFAAAGDSIALEVHGRWPRGVPFQRQPKADAAPTATLNLLVLKGQVELRTASYQFALAAPPGPAAFAWDSVSGPAVGPQRLDALPAWVTAAPPKGIDEVLRRYDAVRAGRTPLAALLELIAASEKDDDPARAVLCRQFGVLSLAALDESARVVAAMELPRWPEVRDVAAVALRHHIGEAAGRDAALFGLLVEELKYPPNEAEAVLQLLHSPFDPDQAETYDTLLAYLRHPRPAVRELARWHLERYLPLGKKFAYDATAAPAERDKAIDAWKELIAARK